MVNVKERNLIICDYSDSGPIMSTKRRVKLMTNIEAYNYAKERGGDCSVELFAPKTFKLDALKNEKFTNDWFYDNGDRTIYLVNEYDDSYYTLAESDFSENTLLKVWNCYGYLLRNLPCSKNDRFMFKRVNNRYYLYMNNDEYGYLDKTSADKMFKDMLSSIFTEKDIYYEVILFPSDSIESPFKNTVVAYETLESYKEAMKERSYFSF